MAYRNIDLIRQQLKEPGLPPPLRKALKQGEKDLSKEEEKFNLVHKYVFERDWLLILLYMKLSKAQIKKIGEKYKEKLKKGFVKTELVSELLGLLGHKSMGEVFQHEKVFSHNDVAWLEEIVNEYCMEERDRWNKSLMMTIKQGKLFTEEEVRKIKTELSKRVGKKVKKETFKLYCEIIEINKRRIANNEDSNYAKSTQLALKDRSFSEDEKDQFYKNFNTWFNSPQNKALISPLLSK